MTLSELEVVRSVYEGYRLRDPSAALSLFSPDIAISQSKELPWGGVYRGHAGALSFFQRLTTHIDSTVEIERLIHAGESVAAVGWTAGTVVSSGASFKVPVVHLWTVREGRVVDVRFVIDNAAMRSALAAGQDAGLDAAEADGQA